MSAGEQGVCGPYDHWLEQYLEGWAEAERGARLSGESRMPRRIMDELRASRLLAAPIPRSLGGIGADLLATAEAVRRVGRTAPSTALALAMPLGNAANARLSDEDVPERHRPRLRLGRRFIAEQALSGKVLAVANSEPGAGGDLANTRTEARSGDDGSVCLTGRKSFATLGPDADFFLCSARTQRQKIDAFFVAREAPGVRLADDWSALGMRTSASVSLTLEQAPVSAGFLHEGAICGASARHWSTVLMAALFVGIGEGALRGAAAELPRNSSWARGTLAECALELEAARAFVQLVARDDEVPPCATYVERCRRAKSFAARTALEVTTRCMMLAGGRAYRPEHALAQALLDAIAGPLLRPPLPQALDAIATELLGPAS